MRPGTSGGAAGDSQRVNTSLSGVGGHRSRGSVGSRGSRALRGRRSSVHIVFVGGRVHDLLPGGSCSRSVIGDRPLPIPGSERCNRARLVLWHHLEFERLNAMLVGIVLHEIDEIEDVLEALVLPGIGDEYPLSSRGTTFGLSRILLAENVERSLANCYLPVGDTIPFLQVLDRHSNKMHLGRCEHCGRHAVTTSLIVLSAIIDPTLLREGTGFFLVPSEEVRNYTSVGRLEIAICDIEASRLFRRCKWSGRWGVSRTSGRGTSGRKDHIGTRRGKICS